MCGIVHRIDERRQDVMMYNVDLRNKTCDCYHWQQSGVPCYHAIALAKIFPNFNFGKEHFYSFCHLDSHLKLFGDLTNNFKTTIPSQTEITNCYEEDPFHNVCYPTFTVIEEGDTSYDSSARFASAGQSTVGMNSINRIQKRINCKHCHKNISIRTIHTSTACNNYKNQQEKKNNKNIIIPETFL